MDLKAHTPYMFSSLVGLAARHGMTLSIRTESADLLGPTPLAVLQFVDSVCLDSCAPILSLSFGLHWKFSAFLVLDIGRANSSMRDNCLILLKAA